MAVNEEGKSTLWRSPLSTPIRRNENSSQDVFQHLEKLIASTVSICRLKGSLECQTGGLITVAEELQRLVRFAVSEISRVERDMKRHKANYEDEIECLKDQVKSLEEEKDLVKKQLQELMKTNQDGTDRGEHTGTEQKRLHLEEGLNGFHSVAEQEDSEANLCSHLACGDAEDSEPLLTRERTSQRKEHSSPLKTTPGKARIGKTKTLKVVAKSDEDADVGKEKSAGKSVKVARKMMAPSSSADDTSCDIITDGGHNTESVEEQPEVLEEEEMEKKCVEFVASKDQSKSNSTRKSSKPRSRGGKKSSGVDKLLESSNDEEQEKRMTEVVKKRKRGLSSRPRGKEERKEKNNTMDPEDRVDKEKVSEQQQIIDDDDKALDEVFQKSPVSVSNVITTPRSNKKLKLSLSSEAKRKPRVDEDEPLVNLSFLIDINMRISDFVNSEVKQLELPPMTSRQRNDVHKLTKLYNIRGRFGNKSDNGTTIVLVKNADTRQPRTGKADALLSELSIVASKETTGTPKAKRKHVSSLEECEGSTTAEELESGDAVKVKKGGKQKKKHHKPKMVQET